jgi:DNA repair protein RecO (recombination protein O)
MVNRVVLEPAFVLHRRPYSNTSYILELFTANHGRMAALARSARGLKSRYKGKLELFSPMWVSWSGQRELKVLGDIELNQMPYLLSGEALWCGFYLNELLLRLLHREDAYQRLFAHYQDTLASLQSCHCLQRVLRRFEKNLLDELGYGLPWHQTVETSEPLEADKTYIYLPDRGFSSQFIESTVTFSGKNLLAFRDDDFSEEAVLRDAKRLMQLALGHLLGSKPLKSRELFAK